MRLVFEKWEFNSYWIVDVTLIVIGHLFRYSSIIIIRFFQVSTKIRAEIYATLH